MPVTPASDTRLNPIAYRIAKGLDEGRGAASVADEAVGQMKRRKAVYDLDKIGNAAISFLRGRLVKRHGQNVPAAELDKLLAVAAVVARLRKAGVKSGPSGVVPFGAKQGPAAPAAAPPSGLTEGQRKALKVIAAIGAALAAAYAAWKLMQYLKERSQAQQLPPPSAPPAIPPAAP
jgi:hypothetical protein